MGQFLEFDFASKRYRQACSLRNAVLRLPLGLSLYDENLEVESGYRHFGVFDGEILLGCLMIAPLEAGDAQLKQMAVDEAYRGQGWGRRLVEWVEGRLIDSGVSELRLHARESAVGFYERLGFAREGDAFMKVTILHIAMRKRIG